MPTIIAILGAPNANSLVDVSFADAYFDAGLGGGAWEELDSDVKERALVQATRDFLAIPWQGRQVSTLQALPFPRVREGAGDGSDGRKIPTNVTAALCEHALDLVKAMAHEESGGVNRAKMRAEGVLSWSLGNRSESLAPGGSLANAAEAMSGKVQSLLQGWIRKSGKMSSTGSVYPGGHYDVFGQWWPKELMR